MITRVKFVISHKQELDYEHGELEIKEEQLRDIRLIMVTSRVSSPLNSMCFSFYFELLF